jgi:hypothetical protein
MLLLDTVSRSNGFSFSRQYRWRFAGTCVAVSACCGEIYGRRPEIFRSLIAVSVGRRQDRTRFENRCSSQFTRAKSEKAGLLKKPARQMAA